MLLPVILSGGSGTRLWPLSRELYPKQMLALVGKGTMLQETLGRLSGVEQVAAPIVVCNENHRFLVAEQLREQGVTPRAIILEPKGRNTAPAVAIAAMAAIADVSSRDADPIVLILPADHVIQDVDAFQSAVAVGVAAAREGKLVTFGVVPTKPETGYGYIRRASGDGPAYPIAQFVEKPDLATAQRYVDSKEYFWNSGMFMFKARAVLDELKALAPKIHHACELAYKAAHRDSDFTRLPAKEFGECPSDSFDYTVMEKTQRGVVVPLDAQWNDVGSWSALHEARAADANDNVCIGDVLAIDSHGSYLQATNRLLATVGLANHVVVETPDAVMVAPMNRVQDVKEIVSLLKKAGRSEAAAHREVVRSWGAFDRLQVSGEYQVLRLKLRAGAALSAQIPARRIEHWIMTAGKVVIEGGTQRDELEPGRGIAMQSSQSYRLTNPTQKEAEIVVVSVGARSDDDAYLSA